MPFWRLFYHITWGTKNREQFILPEFETPIHNAIVAKAQNLGAKVYAVGGIADHVHLAVSVPPTLPLSEFIGQVKGNSSHFANHILALPCPFQWQSEYGVVSFGEKQLDHVIRYVKNQHDHHHDGTLIAFLERSQDE